MPRYRRASIDEEQKMARDPKMCQSKKGNDWHFGLKAHLVLDMATGLVHTVVATAGNVADVTQAHALLHGGEKAVLGDAGYQGVLARRLLGRMHTRATSAFIS